MVQDVSIKKKMQILPAITDASNFRSFHKHKKN